MQQADFTTGLISFINSSPTSFHAVASARKHLEANAFVRLSESEPWKIQGPGRYFITRNDSSLIAFTLANDGPGATGFRIVGAHTDSPGLKIKPAPLRQSHGCIKVAVEVYGGPILNGWLDRDLSIAGRITYPKGNGSLHSTLIDFHRPVAVIPSLAIHLARSSSTKTNEINKETELTPLLMEGNGEDTPDFSTLLLEQLALENKDVHGDAIIDHELFFYDVQPAGFSGISKEFISGSRLDNLLSCYTATLALCHGGGSSNTMIVLNDHEEVGSTSTSGARGSFFSDTLERLLPDTEQRLCCKAKSLLISADNAHALHPNHPDKYDHDHAPRLNHGPAIKLNADQRYATNSLTASFFRFLCKQAGVPVQQFVMRSDMGCGSTVGPLISAESGIKTVDVGVPSLAMHSIRELIGCNDAWYLYEVCKKFFELEADRSEWTSISK